jgi:hypothetical protein
MVHPARPRRCRTVGPAGGRVSPKTLSAGPRRSARRIRLHAEPCDSPSRGRTSIGFRPKPVPRRGPAYPARCPLQARCPAGDRNGFATAPVARYLRTGVRSFRARRSDARLATNAGSAPDPRCTRTSPKARPGGHRSDFPSEDGCRESRTRRRPSEPEDPLGRLPEERPTNPDLSRRTVRCGGPVRNPGRTPAEAGAPPWAPPASPGSLAGPLPAGHPKQSCDHPGAFRTPGRSPSLESLRLAGFGRPEGRPLLPKERAGEPAPGAPLRDRPALHSPLRVPAVAGKLRFVPGAVNPRPYLVFASGRILFAPASAGSRKHICVIHVSYSRTT